MKHPRYISTQLRAYAPFSVSVLWVSSPNVVTWIGRGKHNCLMLIWIYCFQQLDCLAFQRSPSCMKTNGLSTSWSVRLILFEVISQSVLVAFTSCHPCYLYPPCTEWVLCQWKWNQWNGGGGGFKGWDIFCSVQYNTALGLLPSYCQQTRCQVITRAGALK